MCQMNNELTYSYSRVKQLNTCPRCHYYSYFASVNGWRQDAALRTKQIYRLKKLQPIYALVGDSIHSSIKQILQEPSLKVTDFKRLTNRKIKDNYRKSLSNKDDWVENPRLFTMLHEVYYTNVIPEETQMKVIAKIDSCGNNLVKSKSYQELVNNANIMSLDERVEVQFDGYKTFIKADAVYEKDGHMIITDWKTGSGSESDMEQVLLYVYFVSKLFAVPADQIEARLEYLIDGDCAVYIFNARDMECAEEIIRSGIADIKSCYSNPEKGIPYPEVYFRQNKSYKCKYCNFAEICYNGTFPTNCNSEQRKGAALVTV